MLQKEKIIGAERYSTTNGRIEGNNSMESQGYTETDISKYYQQRRHEKWMKLVSSDWFSIFLTYLNIDEILRLDSAFCSHNGRIEWLNLLKTLKPRICVKNNEFADKIGDWLLSKFVHPIGLSFQFNHSNGLSLAISEDCFFKLIRNGSRLKTFEIASDSDYPTHVINKVILPYVAIYCVQLETLNLTNVNIPDNGLEILSNSCHQLKHIVLTVPNNVGVYKLLEVSRVLLTLDLRPVSYSSSPILGDTLEILGLHCQLLQKCLIGEVIIETTDMQIETFTKGCPHLKVFHLEVSSIKIFHKLLHCLGSHNSALEKLHIEITYDEEDEASEKLILCREDEVNDNDMALTNEQTQSLQCLSNGCPLLKEIKLRNCILSTSDISYLVNHSIHLEKIIFQE